MVDRMTGPSLKTKKGSAALTRLLQDSIGNQLRSVYEIDQHIPEHIFRLLRLFEEQTRHPPGRDINPAPADPKVDETSDDQRARHDRPNDTDNAKR